jgi:hypothetical protein
LAVNRLRIRRPEAGSVLFAPGDVQRGRCKRERQRRHDLVGGSVAGRRDVKRPDTKTDVT